MTKLKDESGRGDPNPYDGPIERADGTRPFNRYLWNSEWWWANRDLGYHVSSRWEFGIVHLWDGTFSTCGLVHSIERNNETYEWEKRPARPCVFPDRKQAVRTAGARLIKRARAARFWDGNERLDGNKAQVVIDWIRQTVARETADDNPRPIFVKPPPKPPVRTGLPLLDAMFE